MPRTTKPSTSTVITTSAGPALCPEAQSKPEPTVRSVSRGVSRFAGRLASQFTPKRREQAEVALAWGLTTIATVFVILVTFGWPER